MKLTATILGCGSSGGVPRLGFGWGACDPGEPKNRRSRCALLVEHVSLQGRTRLLVDTGPDMRAQLLAADVGAIDGVFYTHDHADHTHGIDELRVLSLHAGKRIDAYADALTADILTHRFGYCFQTPKGSQYPPILNLHRLSPGESVEIRGAGGTISTLPFRQCHGDIDALGFRWGSLAYSSDVNDLPPESIELLADLEVWIVDALRHKPHSSHFSVSEALDWIERLKVKRAILTNLHTDLDYASLKRELPDHVEPAYDGMRVTFTGECQTEAG